MFINAYAGPGNEQAALAAAREVWPNEHVAASSEILPEIREFERTSTAALNAYVQPLVGGYLRKLEAGLEDGGFSGSFHVRSVERRHHVDRDRAAAAGPHGPVRAGRGRHRGRRHRGGGRPSGRDHGRSRRHLLRRVRS